MKKTLPRRRRPAPAIVQPLRTYSWAGTSLNQGVDRLLELTGGSEEGVTARLFLSPVAASALVGHLQGAQPRAAEPISNSTRLIVFRSILRDVEHSMSSVHVNGSPQNLATRALFDLIRTVANGLIKE